MSFLPEGDELVDLREVLAFVDSSLAADTNAQQGTGFTSTPERPCKEDRAARDARRRSRKKEEAQRLRKEAAQLESKLQWLQDASKVSSASNCRAMGKRKADVPLDDAQRWKQEAVHLRQQRVDAELANRKLRKALASEQEVLKALCATLGARKLPDDEIGLPPVPTSAAILPSTKIPRSLCYDMHASRIQPGVVGLELHAIVEQMQQNASFLCDPLGDPPSISCSFDVRLDPVLGPSPEVEVVTPLDCGLAQAQQLVGPNFRRQRFHDSACTHTVQAQVIAENGAVHKRYAVEVQDLLLDGFACRHQYHEFDRVVLLWAAVNFHQSGSFCIHERGWIIGTQSSANPAQKSVVRMHYDAHSERTGDCDTVDGENVDKLRSQAVRAMGEYWKVRTRLHQQVMLMETGREDLASFMGV